MQERCGRWAEKRQAGPRSWKGLVHHTKEDCFSDAGNRVVEEFELKKRCGHVFLFDSTVVPGSRWDGRGEGSGRPAWEDFWDPSTVLIPVALPTGGTVAPSVILHALPTGGQSEYKHWHGNEKAAETKGTNTSSMLLRVNIHKKYARMSEQKIMRQWTSLNRFSPSLLGPQQKGGPVGGLLPLSASTAPFQADRSLSAFFQAIIFGMTGDFDQPIKLL